MNLRVTYDPSADAAMIYLVPIGPGEAKRVVEAVPQSIILDFDQHNHLIGIEVLNASYVLPKEVWKGAEKLN